MKRIRILVILLTITILAIVLLWRNLNHTGKVGLKDFALVNPESVNKIFLSSNNKKEGYLIIEKDKDGIWWVQNGTKKFKADTTFVKDLLYYVMAKVEVKNPINDAALAGVNKEMAMKAVKAQFYNANEELLTVYAGGPTYDMLGTYMYLPSQSGSGKNHERPCVVTVPGHNGYLTPYFNTDINNWRTSNIIDVESAQIKQLQITWNEEVDMSFVIKKNNGEPELFDNKGKFVECNRNSLLGYLEMFTAVSRESGEPAGINKIKKSKDSILGSIPFFSIEIQKMDGSKQKLKVYHRAISDETYFPETKTGELKTYETESYWAVLEGTDEIWVIQDLVFKNRMRKITDFTKKITK